MKKNIFVFVTVCLMVSLTVSSMAFIQLPNNNGNYNFFKDLYNPSQDGLKGYMIRYDINKYISKANKKDIDKIIQFYDQFTNNTVVSQTIVKYSLEYNMPVNLAFALAYVESSGFDVRAINKNSDGSVDRGLFQLNNKSRPRWKVADFYNIDKNCKEGISFWAQKCSDKSSDMALTFVAYNMGPNSHFVKKSVIPEHRQDYIDEIFKYEDMLNLEFNKAFKI